MIFNKVIRIIDIGENSYSIEYRVVYILGDSIKLEKIREFNNSFNREIDSSNSEELDVYVIYPILYVINGFESEDKWKITNDKLIESHEQKLLRLIYELYFNGNQI